ncbi:MAG: hypothetical protein ACJATV_001738 [Granulosicoccus sp.]|jgi:uncharacterized protein YeaC (DUF1315 family)
MISSVQGLLGSLTPDMYQKLKQSVELGKWPTGGILSNEQKDLCLQAVIAYEKKHFSDEQHTGYIPPKKHTHCGSEKGEIANDEEQPIRFTD